MPILALGFDIDGTLYAESKLYRKLFFKAIPRLRLLYAFNSVRHDIRSLLKSEEYRSKNIKSIDDFHHFQAGLVAKRVGKDQGLVHKEIESFFYKAALEPFSDIPLYKGVKELLVNMKNRGLLLGALSDFPCDEKIRLMGLDSIFDVVMTSEETGFVKPDPASFALFAKRMGVDPGKILFVGNSERYDVAGSIGAGMRAAKISKQSGPSAAEFVFSDYSELSRYLEGLLSKK